MTKLVLLACLSLAACSSDVFSGPDDGGGSDVASSDGTVPDGAPKSDGGMDANVPDGISTGGDAAEPSVDVRCSKDGGVHCTGTDVCCSNESWQLSPSCTAPSGCTVAGDDFLACDDSSDCPFNQVCCATVATGVVKTSTCAFACQNTETQLCKPGQCVAGTCAVFQGQPGWLEACQ